MRRLLSCLTGQRRSKTHHSTKESQVDSIKRPHSVLKSSGISSTKIESSEPGIPLILARSNTIASATKTGQFTRLCEMDLDQIGKTVDNYRTAMFENYIIGSPRVDQLLTLIQFNVFRAFLNNTVSMGFTMEWLESADAISPFCFASSIQMSSLCPASLQPTSRQVAVSHHPWIDLLPVPTMRENLLCALENDWDDTDLCRDLVEFCQEPKELVGLIIWGEPWDPSGWEITEGFLKKWAWVVKDCIELFKSTDHWREMRGDKKLFGKSTTIAY